MQSQKNLYNVVFDAVNDGVWSAISAEYSEQFQNNRSGFTTKYRAIDGAIYKSDDIKQALKNAEESASGFDKLDDIQTMLLNLYAAVYDICDAINDNKVDETTVHTLPAKENISHITLFDEFIPEKIIPLLEFVKGVLKDSRNNISFDDCINLVTIFEKTLDSINTVLKPGYKKDSGNTPVLGGNYLFKITSGQNADEEVKEEKKEEKTEAEKEPLFFEPDPNTKKENDGHKFNFSDYDGIVAGPLGAMDETVPEASENAVSAVKEADEAVSENAAEEQEAGAEEPGKEKEQTKINRFFNAFNSEDEKQEEEPAEKEAAEETVSVKNADIKAGDVYTERLKDQLDDVLHALKEFESSKMLFNNLKESIEIKINLPGEGFTGSSQSIIDEIRKNIDATIQSSLYPLRGKLENDYSVAVDSVNELYDEVEKLMHYLNDSREKLGLDK